jgi:hypothetical protein
MNDYDDGKRKTMRERAEKDSDPIFYSVYFNKFKYMEGK